MKQPSPEMLALRQEGVDLLCEFEDSSLLQQVVALIRQSYMDEIVEYGADGKGITRAQFLQMMEQAHVSIARDEGIADQEMEKWIENL